MVDPTSQLLTVIQWVVGMLGNNNAIVTKEIMEIEKNSDQI